MFKLKLKWINNETQKKKKSSFKQENIISFNINSFYYNLNSLTKGKIIKSNKCKKDIKSLIKHYIKGKKRKYIKSRIEQVK